jgi:hypothetical protein
MNVDNNTQGVTPRGVAILLALILGVTGTVLGIVALTNESTPVETTNQGAVQTTSPPAVVVPNVAGMDLAQVSQTLKDADLKVVTHYAHSASVPKNAVISQSPTQNVRVPQGSSVAITMSVGP